LHELVEELEHARVTIAGVVQILQIVFQCRMVAVNEGLERELYMIRKTFVPRDCFVCGAPKCADGAEAVRLRIRRVDWAVIPRARNLSRDPVMRVGNDLASSGHDLVVERFGHELLPEETYGGIVRTDKGKMGA